MKHDHDVLVQMYQVHCLQCYAIKLTVMEAFFGGRDICQDTDNKTWV